MRRLLATLTLTATAVAVTLTSTALPASADGGGTTYYVNCSSRASGNGTSTGAAWNTLSAIRGHGPFEPGDRILLKRGTTCAGRLTPSGSGTAEAPIRVDAYGSGARPVIAGGGTARFTGAVQLTNQHDWVLRNLHVTNRAKSKWTTVYRSGFMITNTGVGRLAGITISDSLVDDVTSNLADSRTVNSRQYGGISVLTHGTYGSGFDGLSILHNTIDGVSRTGIVTWNSVYNGVHDEHARIAYNVVRKARGDSIVTVGMADSRIDHNTSADGSNMEGCPNCSTASPKLANAGIWPGGSRDLVIDHNEVYGERRGGGDGEGFDIDSSTSHIVLEYNYSHDNGGGGVLLCGSDGAIVRFNVFEDNRASAIAFIGKYPAKRTSIYNNTIYIAKSTGAGVVRYFDGAHGSGISFFNNLVYSYASGRYMWPTKVTSRANTYVGTHAAGEPRGSGFSHVDPGLKRPGAGRTGFGSLTGYKPKHPSTFKRGVAIPSTVTTDFFGKRIDPKHPPRGAAG
ncbi:right-handed parallel beta-helix repeat-containing protein [Amnibacterium kyonggiense]